MLATLAAPTFKYQRYHHASFTKSISHTDPTKTPNTTLPTHSNSTTPPKTQPLLPKMPSYTSSSTFQSTSYSFSSSTINGKTQSQERITHSDPSGTHVQTRSREPGQAPRDSRLHFDAEGRRIQNADQDIGERGRIEDVTDKENEYEERMEEEYAKREGGA
jgi:hypothetical protein